MLDMIPSSGVLYYAVALAAVWGVFGAYRWFRERRDSDRQQKSIETGTSEPPSLHPVIDPAKCVGCSACTNACPEGRIIGMINGKANLIDPSSCIGHGACKTSCPVDAIDLVFGTARRGVDIPVVSSQFESTVPGLFIAGELGGMGLIANAIEQGRQAIDAIAKHERIGADDLYDVVIVGGGPAGIAATLAAKEKQLRYLTLEQDTLGGTVARYPRSKLVMTRPATLPLYGKMRRRRVRKERLIAFWQKVVEDTGIEIRTGVRVEHIDAQKWGFELTTTAGPCRSSTVLLATGRRGSPKRLGIPGEDLPKVVYNLEDARQYFGQHVLVVGGGDSAVEAATTLAGYQVSSVTLSYRRSSFDRVKPVLRRRLEEALAAGKVFVLLDSRVTHIEPDRIAVEQPNGPSVFRNDAVIICIGGLMPSSLLADIGVQVETKYGTA